MKVTVLVLKLSQPDQIHHLADVERRPNSTRHCPMSSDQPFLPLLSYPACAAVAAAGWRWSATTPTM
jgi:hypothetical protein